MLELTNRVTIMRHGQVVAERMNDGLLGKAELARLMCGRELSPPEKPFLAPGADLLATLKTERVRWHPDKIQHRYSALGIEDDVMRSVTEVFQIVDRMWSEERERA